MAIIAIDSNYGIMQLISRASLRSLIFSNNGRKLQAYYLQNCSKYTRNKEHSNLIG